MGTDNATAAHEADIVVLAVPFAAQEATLLSIRAAARGKVVVDTTVPLAEGDPTWAAMPHEGSAAERTQRLLPDSMVVGAFQNIGSKALTKLDKSLETDVLLCGDQQEAKDAPMPLIDALGTRGIDCGPLRQAQVLERITPLVIGLNMRYKKRHTGIRNTGI